MTQENLNVEPVSDAEFENVFNSFCAGESVDVQQPEPEPEDAPQVEETVEAAPEVEEPEGKVEETVEVAPEVEEPVAPEPVVDPLAGLRETIANLEGQIKTLTAQKPQEPEAVVEPEPVLTAEEQAAFDAYVTEYPEGAEAMRVYQKRQQAETAKLVADAVAEVRKEIAPVAQSVATSTQQSYVATIVAKHPDAEALYSSGKLSEWVNTLPSIEKNAYSQILTSSTAGEMIELMDKYKSAQAPAPAAAPVVDTGAADINEELSRQAHVPTSRSKRDDPVDKNKTDGVFAEFCAQV